MSMIQSAVTLIFCVEWNVLSNFMQGNIDGKLTFELWQQVLRLTAWQLEWKFFNDVTHTSNFHSSHSIWLIFSRLFNQSVAKMALLVSFVSVAVSILYTPFLLLILCVIFLASIGKSLGVRRLYVNILLKLFEVRI